MLDVLYSDRQIAVIVKPVGVLSEDGEAGESVCPMLREALGVREVYPVHRLDRAVGGVMVYALTKTAAAALSKAVAENALEKVYLAMVHGVPAEQNGVMTDLLYKDARKNKSYVVTRERKGVKRASLAYETLGSAENVSLVRVTLHTGRSHQIRVQVRFPKTSAPWRRKIRCRRPRKGDCAFLAHDCVSASRKWGNDAFFRKAFGRRVGDVCKIKRAERLFFTYSCVRR